MREKTVESFGLTYSPTIPGQNGGQSSSKTEKIIHVRFPDDKVVFLKYKSCLHFVKVIISIISNSIIDNVYGYIR